MTGNEANGGNSGNDGNDGIWVDRNDEGRAAAAVIAVRPIACGFV